FILQTDHRPLLALFNTSNTKGLSERTAARLRRWALRLIGYDLSIKYARTDDFGQADSFSRLIQDTRQDSSDTEMDQVIATLHVDAELDDMTLEAVGTTKTRNLLRKHTQQDDVLFKVMNRIQNGWHNNDKSDPDMVPYFNQSNILSVNNNIVLA